MSQNKKVKAAVAVMLLGSIAFQMTTFYLVNNKDEDIKKYSYQIIGNTISIFSAVLLFQGFNGFVEAKLIEPFPNQEIFIDFVHMAFWFGIMQLVTAVCSGSVNHIVNLERKFEYIADEKVRGAKLKEFREQNLKCFATMLAHMTGFAAINAWTTVQETDYFKLNPACSLLILPLAFASLTTFFRATDYIRYKIAGADGIISEEEELWDEEAEESENDVIGLALSFTSVQTLRFIVNHKLPDKEGSIPPNEDNPKMEAITLLVLSLVWGVFSVGFSAWFRKQKWHKAKPAGDAVRYCNIGINYFMMSFSWSLLFSAKALLQCTGVFEDEDGILPKVACALAVSFMSFAFIFILDKLGDSDSTGKSADKAIERIVDSMALLIGFSWEASFDTAVDKIADAPGLDKKAFFGPAMAKLVLSMVLCAIVVPAFRLFLLPKVLAAAEEEEDEEPEEEVEEGEAGGATHGGRKPPSHIGLTEEQKTALAAKKLLYHYEDQIEECSKVVHQGYKRSSGMSLVLSFVSICGYLVIVGLHLSGKKGATKVEVAYTLCAGIAALNCFLKGVEAHFGFQAKSVFLHHCVKDLHELHQQAKHLKKLHGNQALDHNLLAHLKKDFDSVMGMICEFLPLKPIPKKLEAAKAKKEKTHSRQVSPAKEESHGEGH